MSSAVFSWGKLEGTVFITKISEIYEEIPKWRKNIFVLPSGQAGKSFIGERTKLINCWARRTPIERISFKAACVMDYLLLQKPFAKSKTKDHVKALAGRLIDWKEGNLDKLLEEVWAIQNHLKKRKRMEPEELGRVFAGLVFQGKVNAALRLLDQQGPRGPQELTDEVISTLRALHPKETDPNPAILQDGPLPKVCDAIFGGITAQSIKQAAMRTQGSAGFSGGDAESWRRQLHSFGDSSNALAEAMALAAKRLCTEFVDPAGIEALIANRLIPLDKDPGTRPIGIGEVMRRIFGKAIMAEIRDEVADCVGVLNLSAGQRAGVESIIHAMKEFFEADDTDALLLVDGINAFNTLNRQVTLLNIRYNCPVLSVVLINFYRISARLFVQGGLELSSRTGTTQGCPFAMSMYALGVLALIYNAKEIISNDSEPKSFTSAWFADDAQAGGKLAKLRSWWDLLVDFGPHFGYFPEPSKTWLVVKPDLLSEAKAIFADSGVQFTTGHRDLGAFIGCEQSVHEGMLAKAMSWVNQIDALSKIALTQPHAAFAAFTHGLQNRWTFCQRTMGKQHMYLLERAIRENCIPSLLGDDTPISDVERRLFALPARFGGLGIRNPHADAKFRLADSQRICADLKGKILSGAIDLDFDREKYKRKISHTKAKWENRHENRRWQIIREAPHLKRIIDFASEKGASSMWTTLPLEKYGFAIKGKRDFRDHLALRYSRTVKGLPEFCACGGIYSLDHSQECKRGGFIHMRHDEPKQALIVEAKQLWNDVQGEPRLEPLSGEKFKHKTAKTTDDARSDVRIRSFWSKGRNAFFEFRVFYPHARSHLDQLPTDLYKKIQNDRKREYEQRIRRVEDGDFTPMIMSSTGGMGPQMSMALKHIAQKLSDKQNKKYPKVIGVLRCKFAFAVARAALVCLRGSRSPYPVRRQLDPMRDVEVAFGEACN
jgi:hypothetical protein